MHSIEKHGFTVNFNGDFSGELIVVTPDNSRFSVPMEVLEAVVAEKIRRARIAALEEESDGVLLYKRD